MFVPGFPRRKAGRSVFYQQVKFGGDRWSRETFECEVRRTARSSCLIRNVRTTLLFFENNVSLDLDVDVDQRTITFKTQLREVKIVCRKILFIAIITYD
jgi:hypothetical protein